jgi:choline dehydrogenase
VFEGRRESTATAYLRPAMSRPNLTVVPEALALGLEIDGVRCTGVRYAHDGATYAVSAGEVVLAAGAVGSPHLLMLAGIGPSAELSRAGVEVVRDLPGVGRNLQDHLLLAGIRYHAERPLDSRGLGEGVTLLARTPGNDRGPDLHLAAMGIDWHLPGQAPSPNSYTIGIGHMRPRSRGEIRLASDDPTDSPIIDPQYLSECYDLEELIRGVELVEEIVQTGVLDDWGGHCDTTQLLERDRPALEAAIRTAAFTYSHLSGSCRMGRDDQAVVDPQLRVHGMDGLRVADASVMPLVVSCNTNAPAVMIGEKAADLIQGRELRDDGVTQTPLAATPLGCR